ncbi:uncharacterized protein ATNIH1004_004873 [Aspergillus tanneri]|uniref:Uncharacterized protein n=1 Tax=Aspergillus tanneri TaxID=1220188 RepID=A0A5M9MVS6_9EURO|nr:uncharacterized protein ATNIH1004_004873 [Aspergillus tanneri]KAA8648983.1 hypothetical protein ATNIH1004_004873 [Aspergillus tanneri]
MHLDADDVSDGGVNLSIVVQAGFGSRGRLHASRSLVDWLLSLSRHIVAAPFLLLPACSSTFILLSTNPSLSSPRRPAGSRWITACCFNHVTLLSSSIAACSSKNRAGLVQVAVRQSDDDDTAVDRCGTLAIL